MERPPKSRLLRQDRDHDECRATSKIISSCAESVWHWDLELEPPFCYGGDCEDAVVALRFTIFSFRGDSTLQRKQYGTFSGYSSKRGIPPEYSEDRIDRVVLRQTITLKGGEVIAEDSRRSQAGERSQDERSPERKSDLEAQADELGTDPAQVGERSAGQAGNSQGLSPIEEASGESVEELSDTDQASEAASLEGLEDAADHPERPVHTHIEYGRPDEAPPQKRKGAA
jgi:hypothetical protein